MSYDGSTSYLQSFALTRKFQCLPEEVQQRLMAMGRELAPNESFFGSAPAVDSDWSGRQAS